MKLIDQLQQYHRVKRTQQQLQEWGARMADQHVRLAVTGLSGSGKSAFITSLVHQLLHANSHAQLPFFSVQSQGRWLGARRAQQPDLTAARFDFEQAMQDLTGAEPVWPASTHGVSQVRLLLKYRPESGLRRVISSSSVLTLDITDYPGEWLLDLPLLQMDYQQWCEHFAKQLHAADWQQHMQPFVAQLDTLNAEQVADDSQLVKLAGCFQHCLQQARQAGLQLIQPGRFVLPGELAGAPVLQFFPLLNLAQLHKALDIDGSQGAVLARRYQAYQQQVIKPFYDKHFRHFDRQIVLVDCLSALNAGKTSFNELQDALNWLLGSFHYGNSNIVKRLFSPKIDKLIFAASKADQVTPEQHVHLAELLGNVLQHSVQHIDYEGVTTQSTACAAIKATQVAQTRHQGEMLTVLTGRDKQGEPLTLFPGDVPRQIPEPEFWQKQSFSFAHFAPPQRKASDVLPHIRMDHILEFVLGDKMR